MINFFMFLIILFAMMVSSAMELKLVIYYLDVSPEFFLQKMMEFYVH
jgi:hypothetical protein